MKEDPPASVSNQNREQAEPGHGSGKERRDTDDTPRGDRNEPSGGESGEGSQSTGDPKSAG